MINIDKLKILYSNAILLEEIKTKDILSFGLNKHDIEVFVKARILTRIKRGYYELSHFKSLEVFSTSLEDDNYKFRAVLKKLLKIDPDNQVIYLKLFLTSLKLKNYEEALSYFNHIYNDKNYKQINNIYLYLLSFLTLLPEEYLSILKNLTGNDFRLSPSDNMPNFNIYNYVFNLIIYDKYKRAIVTLQLNKNKINDYTLHDMILVKLLYLVMVKNRHNIDKITNFLTNKKYDELFIYLNNVCEVRNLNYLEETLYSMLVHYFKMFATKEVPLKKEDNDAYFLTSLMNLDYEQAHEIYEKHYMDQKNNNTVVYNFLEDILNEKDRIRKIDNYITKIMLSLQNNDITKTLPLIKEFLKYIGRDNYLDLVVYLIKISLLEHDFNYTKVNDLLNELKRPYFKFNLDLYINLYKEEVKKYNLNRKEVSNEKIAKIYLEIIKKYGEYASIMNNLITSGNELSSKINEEIIREKVEEAEIDGVAFFDVMENEEIVYAKSLILQIPNVSYFTTLCDGKKRLVIKYNREKKTNFDYKENIKMAKRESINKNYLNALAINRDLLEFFYKPKPSLLAALGFTNMHIGNLECAIKYFTLAGELYAKHGENVNYDYIITKLKSKLNREEYNSNDVKLKRTLDKENK